MCFRWQASARARFSTVDMCTASGVGLGICVVLVLYACASEAEQAYGGASILPARSGRVRYLCLISQPVYEVRMKRFGLEQALPCVWAHAQCLALELVQSKETSS